MDQVRNCRVAIRFDVWKCEGNFSESHEVGEEERRVKKRGEATRRGEDRGERKSREENSREKKEGYSKG
jgi:hypothetical protein